MKDPEQLTYAISLLPDQEAAARIRTAVQELARQCGNDFMTAHDVPPHLTLGVFHARESDLARLQELFKEFSERARGELPKDFCLEFFGADNFLDKVIFLSLGSTKEARKKNPALFGLNAALHKLFLDSFEPGDYENKSVKITGEFASELHEGVRLYAVIMWDATGCCPTGLSIVPQEGKKYPDDFPKEGSQVTVTGKMKSIEMFGGWSLCLVAESWQQ